MTADETPIPAAPTPRTPAQAAAIWGRNAIETDDGWTAPPLAISQHGGRWQADTARALLTPDHPGLPIPPPTVEADIAAVRARMQPDYEWSDR